MPRRRKNNSTKIEVIKVAMNMFLEKGYYHTSIKNIGDELEMSSGHIMFYFPTKEHLLLELVSCLCNYQKMMIQDAMKEGISSLTAMGTELLVMANIADKNDILKEFYIAAYTHPLTLDYIQKNDTDRSKIIYKEYCINWSNEQFEEMEIMASGLEYSMNAGPSNFSAISRVPGVLRTIMGLYNVPEDIKEETIRKVLATEVVNEISKEIGQGFKKYIEEMTESLMEE